MTTETAEPRPERGFSGLRCPDCGAMDTLAVDLETLRVVCSTDVSGCGEWFDADELREHIRDWSALLAWLEAAPLIRPGDLPPAEPAHRAGVVVVSVPAKGQVYLDRQ
jgi:hypothetical protein